MDALWLSEEDVRATLTMADALKAVEGAFREHGLRNTQMPPKSYLYFPGHDGDLRTMPAYLETSDSAGVKIVNVHPGNPARGLPTVMALMVLNSPKTGAPTAVMSGTYLTSMRTGAAGAVAARYLARPDSRTVGLIGAGVQARTQLMGLKENFDIEKVRVADLSMERCKSLAEECRRFLDCEYQLTTNLREACDCDILVTTTPTRAPVVLDAWISEGTHVNAVGADAKGKQELETSLLKRARVVVDDMAQATHSGEVNVPISQGSYSPEMIHAQIGEVVAGLAPGRERDDEITVFDSTGLAIQDVATAELVYRLASESGLGTRLKIW